MSAGMQATTCCLYCIAILEVGPQLERGVHCPSQGPPTVVQRSVCSWPMDSLGPSDLNSLKKRIWLGWLVTSLKEKIWLAWLVILQHAVMLVMGHDLSQGSAWRGELPNLISRSLGKELQGPDLSPPSRSVNTSHPGLLASASFCCLLSHHRALLHFFLWSGLLSLLPQGTLSLLQLSAQVSLPQGILPWPLWIGQRSPLHGPVPPYPQWWYSKHWLTVPRQTSANRA